MGILNIAEWTPDEVAEWMSGLEPAVAQYVAELREKGLNGKKLLTLRCDDLEYLGIRVIGHQELLLEAVEHLRNYHYEVSRECVQQLALRVSAAAASLARELRHHTDARLETNTLADVARTVQAIKPLVCWLDRWAATGACALVERKAALLKLALEAATCAQRERFAEQPARAVAAAAAAAAAVADYIIQDVSDPGVLQPARVQALSLGVGARELGFEVVPSFCGHHQLAHLRFGSRAHASGLVREGDEIIQVGGRCVIGWSGAAVEAACAGAAAERGGDLPLRLRRRAAPGPQPAPPPRRLRYEMDFSLSHTLSPVRAIRAAGAEAERARAPSPAACSSSSDGSEPLSPPASPTLHPDTARMYPPKPRSASQRRHTVSCGTPVAQRPHLTIEQFWQELQQQRWVHGNSPEPEDSTLYRRDKAVSCSTGLQLSPRPRTHLGVGRAAEGALPPAPAPARGRLDKSHSTPAYDCEAAAEPGALACHPIPESPTTPTMDTPALHLHLEKAGQILDFKKSSSQIEEAILRRSGKGDGDDRADIFTDDDIRPIDEDSKLEIVESVNIIVTEKVDDETSFRSDRSIEDDVDDQRGSAWGRAPEPPPRGSVRAPPPPPRARDPPQPAPLPQYGALRLLPRAPPRPADTAQLQISVPLRHITKHDIKLISTERRVLPPINGEPETPLERDKGEKVEKIEKKRDEITVGAQSDGALSPGASVVRGIFPSSKTRSLKKKNSILAKRREVAARSLAARGASGRVWQRVRPARSARARWAPRHLLLAHNMLYAFRTPECSRAACMIYLEGFTACAAAEVRSRAHAFKVYHTGTAFYFACDSADAALAWIHLISRATLLPKLPSAAMELSKQYSETDYSDSDSDPESPDKRSEKERDREKEKEKDKSKFGSLKKLRGGSGRSDSQENVSQASSTSLDRKYLRFFSRTKTKEDTKNIKSKQSGVPVATEHYRSYRRAGGPGGSAGPGGGAAAPRAGGSPVHPAPGHRLPKPINYIHASNPNLLDFEKSDFVTKPALQPPPKPKVHKPDFIGFVTLEEFMLKKQEEERRSVYSERRVGAGATETATRVRARELQRRLDSIVPDVIYGELPRPGVGDKPVSLPGHDGYEKIVYPEERVNDSWKDSLRRNDKVHSGSPPAAPPAPQGWGAGGAGGVGGASGASGAGGASGVGVSRLRLMFGGGRRDTAHKTSGAGASAGSGLGSGLGAGSQYPHLQCPPTFQPETYSLARPPAPHHTPAPRRH